MKERKYTGRGLTLIRYFHSTKRPNTLCFLCAEPVVADSLQQTGPAAA